MAKSVGVARTRRITLLARMREPHVMSKFMRESQWPAIRTDNAPRPISINREIGNAATARSVQLRHKIRAVLLA